MPTKKKSPPTMKVTKRKLLGVFLIIAFVALGSVIVTHYLLKAKVDLRRTALITLSISGILAVYIEMRGKLGKKTSGIKSKIKSKIKRKSKGRRR